MRCAYAEDVVAHFHDGAVPATTDAATLAEHLHRCETCQRTLAHARRIDGLLASISGVDVDPLLAERLLGKLPDPEPRTRPLLTKMRSSSTRVAKIAMLQLTRLDEPRAPASRVRATG